MAPIKRRQPMADQLPDHRRQGKNRSRIDASQQK
jgi:hypothetical protein